MIIIWQRSKGPKDVQKDVPRDVLKDVLRDVLRRKEQAFVLW